jgi:hypothetical protein
MVSGPSFQQPWHKFSGEVQGSTYRHMHVEHLAIGPHSPPEHRFASFVHVLGNGTS